ncbi:hypothetical protein [Martelella alba]|nr:hypothetical protein [Martelella alba]
MERSKTRGHVDSLEAALHFAQADVKLLGDDFLAYLLGLAIAYTRDNRTRLLSEGTARRAVQTEGAATTSL